MSSKQADLLRGVHLLITRPVEQAYVWAQQLRELGAIVTVRPMLAIKPLTDKKSVQKMCVLEQFDKFQKAIFISRNAVSYGIEMLNQYCPRIPSTVQFFAIGYSTALSLSMRGFDVQRNGIPMNSEALLKLAAMNDVDGQKIMIFRGCGGRTYLGDQLSKRGALVEYCETYQREPPPPYVQVLPSTFYNTEHPIPITTVHSGETLANLVNIVPSSQLYWLRQQPLLIPGQRVAAAATKIGFSQLLIAKNATHTSMIEALYEWRKRKNQIKPQLTSKSGKSIDSQ